MKKNHLIQYIVFILLIGGGWIWGTYLGGFISGIGFTLAILVSLGRRQANRAANIIDKKIKDHYENL